MLFKSENGLLKSGRKAKVICKNQNIEKKTSENHIPKLKQHDLTKKYCSTIMLLMILEGMSFGEKKKILQRHPLKSKVLNNCSQIIKKIFPVFK